MIFPRPTRHDPTPTNGNQGTPTHTYTRFWTVDATFFIENTPLVFSKRDPPEGIFFLPNIYVAPQQNVAYTKQSLIKANYEKQLT